MDLRVLLEGASLLTKQPEGEVYKVSYGGKDYVLKKRLSWPGCLEHEYKVGLELDKLGLPWFGKTYQHQVNSDYDLLLLEYLEGETLAQLSRRVTEGTIATIIKEVLMIILHTQKLVEYTHYDLHHSNIIVKELAIPTTKNYHFFDQDYTISSNFHIWIIDHGGSHIAGLEHGEYESNIASLSCGVVPSVFDNLYDLSVVTMAYIYKYKKPSAILNEALTAACFEAYYGGSNPYAAYYGRDEYYQNIVESLVKIDNNYFGGKNQRFFFATEASNFFHDYLETLMRMASRKRRYTPDEVRIQLGRCMNVIKRFWIGKRLIQPQGFYEACLAALN